MAKFTAPSQAPANDPGPPGLPADPDRWNWPHSEAMTGAEVERMQARLELFIARRLTEADALAGRLAIRDREGDDRRCCAECGGLVRAGGERRCTRSRAAGLRDAGLPTLLITQLQRCPTFTPITLQPGTSTPQAGITKGNTP